MTRLYHTALTLHDTPMADRLETCCGVFFPVALFALTIVAAGVGIG